MLVAQDRNDPLPKSCIISEQFLFQASQSFVPVTVGSDSHIGGWSGKLLGEIWAAVGEATPSAIAATAIIHIAYRAVRMFFILLVFT